MGGDKCAYRERIQGYKKQVNNLFAYQNICYLCTIGIGTNLRYMGNHNHTAPLIAGGKSRTEYPCILLVPTPATKEFCYSPPSLIISSEIKSKGVIKYVDNTSVCSVKNHIIRPADLWGEVINDANRGNHLAFLLDLPDFGNYEAGAN